MAQACQEANMRESQENYLPYFFFLFSQVEMKFQVIHPLRALPITVLKFVKRLNLQYFRS